MHLTAAGAALVEGCAEVFGALDRIETALSGLRGLEAGCLRLAVCTTGKYFAPRLLGEFLRRHPKLEVSLQIHNRRGLLERLARNEDDLYVFGGRPEAPEVVCQPILANPLVVFARADHRLAGRRSIPFAELAQEPFLMREPGSGTRQAAWEAFDRHGIAQTVRMELSTNEAVKQAILAGLGISILPRYTLGLDTEQAQLAVLDVEGFPLERQWQFAYPVGKQISPVARAFMDFVRAEAKDLVQAHLGQAARR